LGAEPVHVSAIPDLNYDVMVKDGQAAAALALVLSRNGNLERIEVPAQTALPTLLEGVEHTAVLATQITGVAEDAPAQAAGLQPGDLVYSVGDTTITPNTPLNEIIHQHAGEEISVTVLRDQNWKTVSVTPRVNPPEGQGALGIQIGPLNQLATLPVLESLWQGVRSTSEYIMVVLQLPVMLLMGQISPADAQLSGPVGIAQMVGGAMSATLDTGLWFPILRLSAVLSAALAITNLLPLPALDGGRLLFIAVEAIRGRRVNPEREGMIHMVGFMLLLGLLVLVTVRDITSAQQGIDWHMILGQ
jgi:regulator of sigma E protease